jgi:hypothetical protein
VRKQLFYLTNSSMAACTWQGGRLGAPVVFDNDADGWHAFGRHIHGTENLPACLLVDLVEEDFQRDSIPHVMGRARHALIERRLTQLYRETPYRQATVQGREKEGRKDDRMLFSAITNAELIRPWIDAMNEACVPLAGIYSVALLSQLLLKKLVLGNQPLLLVTHLKSGLRHSYCDDGQLRFSRLTPLSGENSETIADALETETAKTRQFLASTRLLPREAPVTVVMLTATRHVAALQSACVDSATVMYRFLALDDCARQLRVRMHDDAALSEQLFLSLLGARAPARHYMLPQPTRLYRLWQTRVGLYAASAATALAALALTGVNSFDAIDTAGSVRQTTLEANAADARYRTLVASLTGIKRNPSDMRAAVEMHRMLDANAPGPSGLLKTISQALAAQPLLQINRIDWQTSDTEPPAVPTASPGQQGDVDPPPSGAAIGIPGKPYELLLIDGEVAVPPAQVRSALDSVQQFVATLQKDSHLAVTLTRTPIDISPGSRLTGQAGSDAAETRPVFAIRIVRKP